MTFFKASEILHSVGWKLTADGNRGYYLNDGRSMAWCSSPEEVVKFVENLEISTIFNDRTKKYAEEYLEEESKKQVASTKQNENQS